MSSFKVKRVATAAAVVVLILYYIYNLKDDPELVKCQTTFHGRHKVCLECNAPNPSRIEENEEFQKVEESDEGEEESEESKTTASADQDVSYQSTNLPTVTTHTAPTISVVSNPQTKLVSHVHKSSRSAIYIPPKMDISLQTLRTKSLKDPKTADLSKAVFVTAVDYTHFKESKSSIASIQKHLPNITVIYYDLGLWWSSYIREVKSWCGVTYRKLNFTKYPAHLKDLHTYAFKPIVIQEVLQEHDTVIWFDASIRVKCPNLLKQIEPIIRKSGIVTVDFSGHSCFAATHPDMYRFLLVNDSLLVTDMMGSGFIALTNSQQLFDHVIVWWVRCALWNNCMAPPQSRLSPCNFTDYKPTVYVNCHRYDQSALNLLLLDMFKGNVDMYSNRQACLSVERSNSMHVAIQSCSKDNNNGYQSWI